MTEEVIVETPEGESTQVETPQFSELEQAALEKGWKPREEYNGDPNHWRSAEVFMALDEPLRRIESQSKELKKVREALDALSTHHKRVKEVEYNRALKQLQEARKQAFREGEHEQALALEERIDELKEEKQNIVLPDLPNEQEQTVHPEFQAWVNKNPWYEKDEDMRAVADSFGLKLRSQGLEPQDVLKRVEEKIRDKFKDQFSNTKAKRPNAVESSSRSGNSASNELTAMSEEDRKMMRKIVASGALTEAEYLKEYKAVNKGN